MSARHMAAAQARLQALQDAAVAAQDAAAAAQQEIDAMRHQQSHSATPAQSYTLRQRGAGSIAQSRPRRAGGSIAQSRPRRAGSMAQSYTFFDDSESSSSSASSSDALSDDSDFDSDSDTSSVSDEDDLLGFDLIAADKSICSRVLPNDHPCVKEIAAVFSISALACAFDVVEALRKLVQNVEEVIKQRMRGDSTATGYMITGGLCQSGKSVLAFLICMVSRWFSVPHFMITHFVEGRKDAVNKLKSLLVQVLPTSCLSAEANYSLSEQY